MASVKTDTRFGHLPNYFSRNEPDKIDARLVDALAEGTISMKEYAIYANATPEELDQVGALHPVDEETEKFGSVPNPRAAPAPEDFEQALAGLEAGMRFMVRAGIPADSIKECIYRTKAWGGFMGLYSGAIPAAKATRPRPAPRPKPAPKMAYNPFAAHCPFGGDGLHYPPPAEEPVYTIPQGPPPPPSANPKPAPVQRSFNYGGAEFRDCYIRECDLESQPRPGLAKAMWACADEPQPDISVAELGKLLESEGVLPESPTKAISVKEQATKMMVAADEKLYEAQAGRERAAKLISEAKADRERATKMMASRETCAEPQLDIKNLALDEFVFIGPDGEEHPIMFLKSKKK
jgi:hypothetical protein